MAHPHGAALGGIESKPVCCAAAPGTAPCSLCTRHAPYASLAHCGACKAVVCCACCAAPSAPGDTRTRHAHAADEPLCLECAWEASLGQGGGLDSGPLCSDGGGGGSAVGTPECQGGIERACWEAALRPALSGKAGRGAVNGRGSSGGGGGPARGDDDAGLPFGWCTF